MARFIIASRNTSRRSTETYEQQSAALTRYQPNGVIMARSTSVCASI
jgi:hypothetical protein